MPKTSYLINKFEDWEFRGQAFTPPATLYIALFTVAPTIAGGGTEVASGIGYSRQAVTSNLTDWSGTQGQGTTAASSGTSGSIENNVAINFGTVGSTGWGTVVAFGVYDAATGGNLLEFAPLTTSQTLNTNGVAVSFPANALSFNLS